jgi:hypothetical protein
MKSYVTTSEHLSFLPTPQISGLYSVISTWEQKDPKNLITILRRRSKMIAPLVDELNPSYYKGERRFGISFYW